jgi:hypothetical protein
MDHLVVAVADKFVKLRSLSLPLHLYKLLSVQVVHQLPSTLFPLFPLAETVKAVQ